MLVIANGAYKSGSTWQYYILKKLTQYEPPPEEFLTWWKHPSLDLEKMEAFLESGMHRTGNYLVKQHINCPRLDVFRPYMDGSIMFFDILRDYRDVVVSAYYHKKRDGWRTGFTGYYWFRGRFVHRIVRQHHRDMENVVSPRLRCTISYEGLQRDFARETRKMAELLDIEVDTHRIYEIQRETSFKQMRRAYNEESVIHGKDFFRKGIVGDYANYYGWLELRDFREIEGLTRTKLTSLVGTPLTTAFRAWRKGRQMLGSQIAS